MPDEKLNQNSIRNCVSQESAIYLRMRHFLGLVLLLLTSVGDAQQTKVLFLGNSYTAANNLPQLVYDLALSGGDTIIYDSNTPGGYTFELHTQNATSLQKINAQDWDYVVLQGQSQQPALDTPYVIANVFPYATRLDSFIHANDSCSQTVFYMTWGRKFGDQQFCATYPPVCTFDGMSNQLRGRYLQMGYDNNAVVAPAGAAWVNAIAGGFVPDLFSGDGSHPSLHGSYLTACVFYATIFKRTPVGLTYYAGLPQGEAAALQQYAHLTVMDSLDYWNAWIDYPTATVSNAFIGSGTYQFNTQQGYSGYFWNFGDNTSQAGTETITHTYAQPGTYIYNVTISNGCHEITLQDTIVVTTVGEQDITGNTTQHLYPNPASNLIYVSATTNSPYIILNMQGQQVKSGSIQNGSIDVQDLPNGVYFLQWNSGVNIAPIKFIIINLGER